MLALRLKYRNIPIAWAGILALLAMNLCAASTNRLGFELTWPVTDPEVTNKTTLPLLLGELQAAQTGEVLTVNITLSQKRPETSTGFDREDWIGRYSAESRVNALSVLSEAP